MTVKNTYSVYTRKFTGLINIFSAFFLAKNRKWDGIDVQNFIINLSIRFKKLKKFFL